MQLKFGDINVLIENTRNIPHLIEKRHECDCEYCTCDEVIYICSKCKHDTHDFDKFEDYKCPKCGTRLISED